MYIQAGRALKELSPGGQTNLWDGLHKGMEALDDPNLTPPPLTLSLPLALTHEGARRP